MLSDRETPLKTIGNRLGVWNGMKVNRLMRPAGLCSELMGVQFKHHFIIQERQTEHILPDVDSLWQSRSLLIHRPHWHYDTWTEIRVWALPTGEFFTGQHGCKRASVLERLSLPFRQKNEDPFHPWFDVQDILAHEWLNLSQEVCTQSKHSRKKSFMLWHRHLVMIQNSRLGQAHLKHCWFPVGGLNMFRPFSTPADGPVKKKKDHLKKSPNMIFQMRKCANLTNA